MEFMQPTNGSIVDAFESVNCVQEWRTTREESRGWWELKLVFEKRWCIAFRPGFFWDVTVASADGAIVSTVEKDASNVGNRYFQSC
jgi:hypothetical protein